MKGLDSYVVDKELGFESDGADSAHKAIATEHILSAILPGHPDPGKGEDFPSGDQDQDLNLVAQKN